MAEKEIKLYITQLSVYKVNDLIFITIYFYIRFYLQDTVLSDYIVIEYLFPIYAQYAAYDTVQVNIQKVHLKQFVLFVSGPG